MEHLQTNFEIKYIPYGFDWNGSDNYIRINFFDSYGTENFWNQLNNNYLSIFDYDITNAIKEERFETRSFQGNSAELYEELEVKTKHDLNVRSAKYKKFHIERIAELAAHYNWGNSTEVYQICGIQDGNSIKMADGLHRLFAAKYLKKLNQLSQTKMLVFSNESKYKQYNEQCNTEQFLLLNDTEKMSKYEFVEIMYLL